MKLITAIIKPSRLDAAIDALKDADVDGVTVTEVRGFGRQRGRTEVYRGAEYEVTLLPKMRIEVAASDDAAERIIEALSQAGRTGKIGDGKIWVCDLDALVRIRTGERDAAALVG